MVDARLHAANELAGQILISGGVARLDEHLQLPVMGTVLVVAQGVAQGHRGLTFVALRTQPQINAEDRTLARGAGESFGNHLGEADKIFAQRQRGFGRKFTIAKEEHEINIGVVVELIAAELAKREHRKRDRHKPAIWIQTLGRTKTILHG